MRRWTALAVALVIAACNGGRETGRMDREGAEGAGGADTSAAAEQPGTVDTSVGGTRGTGAGSDTALRSKPGTQTGREAEH